MAENNFTAPQTHKQPSRKGKRAWRKNVDISTITSGLENAREEATLTGGHLFADTAPDALYQTDVTGSTDIQTQIRKSGHAQLKADEIIAQRSKMPAISAKKGSGVQTVTDGVLHSVGGKRKRGTGVSHRELERLKQVAYGGDAAQPNLKVVDGPTLHDPWAEEEPAPKDEKLSYLESSQKIRPPKTLKAAPISLISSGKAVPNVPRPNAGRSYNPAYQDWTALLEREGDKEVQAEKRRLRAAEEEKERIDRAAAAAEEVEKQEQERLAFSDYDSDWDGIQSDIEETQLKAKRPERKTPAERNKIQRRKAAAALARHEERMRQRDRQTKQIDAIRRAVEMKEQALSHTRYAAWEGFHSDISSSEEEETGDVELRRRRLGKFVPPNAPLEVVLPDELQDSLRLLKPEGSLFKDRFRSLVVQGKIEARRPVGQSKKPNRKATEKWSYKDWRVPGM